MWTGWETTEKWQQRYGSVQILQEQYRHRSCLPCYLELHNKNMFAVFRPTHSEPFLCCLRWFSLIGSCTEDRLRVFLRFSKPPSGQPTKESFLFHFHINTLFFFLLIDVVLFITAARRALVNLYVNIQTPMIPFRVCAFNWSWCMSLSLATLCPFTWEIHPISVQNTCLTPLLPLEWFIHASCREARSIR